MITLRTPTNHGEWLSCRQFQKQQYSYKTKKKSKRGGAQENSPMTINHLLRFPPTKEKSCIYKKVRSSVYRVASEAN